MNRLISVIPAAIVLIVAVSMGIGAALLGYPAWAIPLIALFGAGGAILAVRVLSYRGLEQPVSSENWLTELWRAHVCRHITVCRLPRREGIRGKETAFDTERAG